MDNYGRNFHAPKVDVHAFSMIPRADIPRSSFRMQHQHKTTIEGSQLFPIYLQEILPGDSFNVQMNAYVRMATLVYPLMDNVQLESFFFFVPNRLVWKNWQKFQGEQDNPADSISFSIPQIVSPVGGFAQLSLYDYFGLPCVGQIGAGNTVSVNALPLRCYNLIFNQWFRDQNLINSVFGGSLSGVGPCAMDDGPDPQANYTLIYAMKRHDYFTSCLPWTQKGTPVSLPLGTSATVRTAGSTLVTGAQNAVAFNNYTTGAAPTQNQALSFAAAGSLTVGAGASASNIAQAMYPANLYADLSTATAATINQIRLAFQTQRLLERDARGGTRYTEIIRSHFGVISPDARLQRPEYLGGGKSPINVSPVPQTSATGLTGGAAPIGTLAGAGLGTAMHGFRQSFTEHGYILGLVTVRHDQIYQQGLRKLWSRKTRYDFYMPVFAMLGEQSVLNSEIFCDGSANDVLTFGYQERWAEYRYHPSFTSGYFKSTNATPLDAWHLGTKYAALPTLGGLWILDNTNTNIQRVVAAGASSAKQQFLCDFFFDERAARPMPTYSVPGMVDHF